MDAPQPQPAAADRKGSLLGKVIVLLEDDELIRRATERMLRRFGAEVVTGTSSHEVLEAMTARGLTPSVVIADYWLSRQENGLSAAATVCDLAGMPVNGLIITGDSSPEIASNVVRAGFQLLRKPVNVESFLDAILRTG